MDRDGVDEDSRKLEGGKRDCLRLAGGVPPFESWYIGSCATRVRSALSGVCARKALERSDMADSGRS